MWERGARHNPLSLRYMMYLDHRPVLPQDPTTNLLSSRYSDYARKYYLFVIRGNLKVLYSNNIPARDRENMKQIEEYNQSFKLTSRWLSVFPSILTFGVLFKYIPHSTVKMAYPAGFLLTWYFYNTLVHAKMKDLYDLNMEYFYHKYSHLATSRLDKIDDPRRKHFTLDTSVYYRQTASEIQHGGHDEGHASHDTNNYYGPYPVNNNFFNFLVH